MNPPPLPREPHRLLREVSAAIRLRDIEEWQRLRDSVAIQWWESALVTLLFISGVGIIVTISQLIPRQTPLLYYFILAWCVLWILTLISCIEFLINKFRSLRRMHEITERTLHQMHSDIEELRKAVVALKKELEEDSDTPAPEADKTPG